MMNSKLKDAFKSYGRNIPYILKVSAIITLFLIVFFGAGILLFVSLYNNANGFVSSIIVYLIGFVGLLIGMPLIYALFVVSMVLADENNNDEAPIIRIFFDALKSGMQSGTRRCVPVFKNLILSIVCNGALVFVLTFLLYLILLIVNPNFKELVVDFGEAYLSGGVGQILKNETFIAITEILEPYEIYVVCISALLSFLLFIVLTLKGLIAYCFIPVTIVMPLPMFIHSIKQTLKENRNDLNKKFFALGWLYILVAIVISSVSFILLYNFTEIHLFLQIISSIFFAVIILIPLLPILFNYYMSFFGGYLKSFIKVTKDNINRGIEELNKSAHEFSESDQKQIKLLNQTEIDLGNQIEAYINENFKKYIKEANKKDKKEK